MNARTQAQLCSQALFHNLTVLGNKVPHLKLIPMIKANAYGHGMVWAASVLEDHKSIFAFGVATLAEAIALRPHTKHDILIFSDTAPWSEEKHQACKKFKLSPVFSNFDSYQSFISKADIPYHLEFNTGMNRLGLQPDSMNEVQNHTRPVSVFTHMAEAENPDSRLSKMQIKKFESICDWTRSQFSESFLHFGNSAAIWNAKKYPLMKKMDLARPGLSLYGVRPFEEAKEDKTSKLKRVMTLSGPVLNEIILKKGDRVGYGGTYTCKNARGEKIAVIGSGYADGIFRSLGNQGFVAFNGKKLKFLGRVSMDLSAVQATRELKLGNRVEFWGENVDPYDQANAAGTNPYEIMTRIGERVERVYI